MLSTFHKDRVSGMRHVLSGLEGRIHGLEARVSDEGGASLQDVARMEAFIDIKRDIENAIAREVEHQATR